MGCAASVAASDAIAWIHPNAKSVVTVHALRQRLERHIAITALAQIALDYLVYDQLWMLYEHQAGMRRSHNVALGFAFTEGDIWRTGMQTWFVQRLEPVYELRRLRTPLDRWYYIARIALALHQDAWHYARVRRWCACCCLFGTYCICKPDSRRLVWTGGYGYQPAALTVARDDGADDRSIYPRLPANDVHWTLTLSMT